jgi:hypothetical protein
VFSLLVVVRDDKDLSFKAKFFVSLVKSNLNVPTLYIFRKDKEKFKETWSINSIGLATSTSGVILYFLNYFLKSPRNIRDRVIRRLQKKTDKPAFNYEDAFTAISQALYQYLGRSGRNEKLLQLLEKEEAKKVFLIDEFFSLNVINIKKLERLGSIVYLSSDVASDFYRYSAAASKLMQKFEQNKIARPNLVLACSERDSIKYLEMGARKVVYYPNIYPAPEFEMPEKDQTPSICIIMRGHWGNKTSRPLKETFRALSYISQRVRVYTFGVKPQNIPKNVDLHYYDYIPSRLDYLRTLGKSWIGINLGVHAGGSNQRKYDYALAGLVVFSDKYGVRGDLLPHEFSYIDSYDLTAKINQLLTFDKKRIFEMGIENQKYVLSFAKNKQSDLEEAVKNLFKFEQSSPNTAIETPPERKVNQET